VFDAVKAPPLPWAMGVLLLCACEATEPIGTGQGTCDWLRQASAADCRPSDDCIQVSCLAEGVDFVETDTRWCAWWPEDSGQAQPIATPPVEVPRALLEEAEAACEAQPSGCGGAFWRVSSVQCPSDPTRTPNPAEVVYVQCEGTTGK